jgi:tetratricopeptide (TPR) repeat protein
MLAAFDLYLGEPETQALPEAPTVAVDRAELLLRHGRLAEAEAGLREVLRAHDGEPVGARAGLLLMRSLQARWQDPAASPAAQAQARAGLIATTQELQRLRAMSLATTPSEELRRRSGGCAGRRCGRRPWRRGQRGFAECARVFDEMAEETGIEGQAEATLRFEAAGCHEQGGAFAAAIAGYDGWLRRFAADRRAAEVELRLARVNERVQNVEDARDHYIRFVALAPDDARASEARRRSIALALVTGTVDAEQVAALTRDRRSGDRLLAAAIRFRTEVRPGSPHARVMGYLQQFGRDGGERRLAIAHLRAAEALMRSSCPVGAVDGLCVEVTRDKTLGRVLPRDKGQVVQARAHLQAAAGCLSVRGADDGLEAPLAVAPGEVAAARRVLSLLLGDLGAEAALSTRPPASYEPTRSREWFERRVSEVQRMQAVYEGSTRRRGATWRDAVATSASDRFAAVIEARKAQVYEADIGLLEEVSRAIAEQSAAGSDGAALAVTMQRWRTRGAGRCSRRITAASSWWRCGATTRTGGRRVPGRARAAGAALRAAARVRAGPACPPGCVSSGWLLGQVSRPSGPRTDVRAPRRRRRRGELEQELAGSAGGGLIGVGVVEVGAEEGAGLGAGVRSSEPASRAAEVELQLGREGRRGVARAARRARRRRGGRPARRRGGRGGGCGRRRGRGRRGSGRGGGGGRGGLVEVGGLRVVAGGQLGGGPGRRGGGVLGVEIEGEGEAAAGLAWLFGQEGDARAGGGEQGGAVGGRGDAGLGDRVARGGSRGGESRQIWAARARRSGSRSARARAWRRATPRAYGSSGARARAAWNSVAGLGSARGPRRVVS